MEREFLKGLELEGETIDKIMAEHGKSLKGLKEQIEDDKKTIEDLKNQLNDAPKTDELENLKKTIADYETKEKERVEKQKHEEEEKKLNETINSLFEGKKFTSDYARKGLLNDIKEGLNNPDNKGKGAKDLFDELTKDKTDIFSFDNEEQKDMEGIGESEQETNIKEIPILF